MFADDDLILEPLHQCSIGILEAFPNVAVSRKPPCQKVQHLFGHLPPGSSFPRNEAAMPLDPLYQPIHHFRGHVQLPGDLHSTKSILSCEHLQKLELFVLLLLRLRQLHVVLLLLLLLCACLPIGFLDHFSLQHQVVVDLLQCHLSILDLLTLLVRLEAPCHQDVVFGLCFKVMFAEELGALAVVGLDLKVYFCLSPSIR